jgi:hypothetical protein
MSDTFPSKSTYWPSASTSNTSAVENLVRGVSASSSGTKAKLDTDFATTATTTTPQHTDYQYQQTSPRQVTSNNLHNQQIMLESTTTDEISKRLIVRVFQYYCCISNTDSINSCTVSLIFYLILSIL